MIASFNHHGSTSCPTATCNLIAIITTSPELWDLFAVKVIMNYIIKYLAGQADILMCRPMIVFEYLVSLSVVFIGCQ